MIRRVVIVLVALAAVYVLAVAGMLVVMLQPPERFAAAMSRVPLPVMMAMPFRPLWMRAREGNLKVGELAPDFRLPSADRKSEVQLSAFRGQRPVVLVFGSYT